MMQENLRLTLEKLAAGAITVEQAETSLQNVAAGIADLGDIKLDIDRRRRRGIAEAIFCQGKTPEQVLEIVTQLDAAGQTIICTRVSEQTAEYVIAARPDIRHFSKARILGKRSEPSAKSHGTIAVVTAGTTDIGVAEEAAVCLELWGNNVDRIYDVGVAGLQRLLLQVNRLQQASVVICAAGMEAALPSVVAGLIQAPLVALPTSVGYGASFGGITALLGMLNSCSGGIATVNIDNGFGAALLAHMINHVGLTQSTIGETTTR